MAEDREQKIRDVAAAMRATYDTMEGPASKGMEALARAAVDVLDPIKVIELSGGFHAEPAPLDPMRCNIFDKPGPHTIRLIGNLSRDAARAWAEAAISHQKLNQRHFT